MIVTQTELESLAYALAIRYSKKPKRKGGGWVTNCPVHDDEHGSMTLDMEAGKPLWCCQAGCRQDALTTAIKPYLPKGSDKRPNVKQIPDKIYQYHNADGQLVFEKVRYIPKDFRVRQPAGTNNYIWNLKGADTNIIYYLPEVLRAVKDGEVIYIAEGEKDCDKLTALDLVATCNIFGASTNGQKPKWTDKHASWLKGTKEAVIFPDNDDAGRAHAKVIFKSLQKIGVPCKIIGLPGLPDKGDVSDWLANGGTKEELLKLIENTQHWQPGNDYENVPDERATEPEGNKLADRVVNFAINTGATFFHDSSGIAYATITVGKHLENWKIHSKGFKQWLRNAWFKTHQEGLSAQVLGDVLDTLDAKANCEGKEHTVYIRLAHVNGEIYVDLGDKDWQVIHITSKNWTITNQAPVRFRRTPGMLPLPTPIQGGIASQKINKLRQFINATDDDNWQLIAGWILGAFSRGPYAILAVLGEQGSSKTFLCKICRNCIDPSEVILGSAPREARDVIIACQNSHIYGCNNLSKIDTWLSDLLCTISDGNAYRERKYHTNSGDEVLFKARCPIIFNGIDLSLRGDLADRALLVTLSHISDDNRKEEVELEPQIQEAMPEILGGIFDVLVSILKNLPTTKLKSKPRMADFARWVTAGESAMGWKPGTFMQTYSANREQAVELTIESDSFGSELRDFIDNKISWTGSWNDLIEAMNGKDKAVPKLWPHSGKALIGKLTRLTQALKHFEINWKKYDTATKRGYKIWKGVLEVSQASQTSGSNTSVALDNDTLKKGSVPNDTLSTNMTYRGSQVSYPNGLPSKSCDTYDTNDTSKPLIPGLVVNKDGAAIF